jgi:hypothetical protein
MTQLAEQVGNEKMKRQRPGGGGESGEDDKEVGGLF